VCRTPRRRWSRDYRATTSVLQTSSAPPPRDVDATLANRNVQLVRIQGAASFSMRSVDYFRHKSPSASDGLIFGPSGAKIPTGKTLQPFDRFKREKVRKRSSVYCCSCIRATSRGTFAVKTRVEYVQLRTVSTNSSNNTSKLTDDEISPSNPSIFRPFFAPGAFILFVPRPNT